MKDFKFEGYNWIKVPKFKIDPNDDPKISLKGLEDHHTQETTFLINKVRELGAMLEEIKDITTDEVMDDRDVRNWLYGNLIYVQGDLNENN